MMFYLMMVATVVMFMLVMCMDENLPRAIGYSIIVGIPVGWICWIILS